MDEFLKMLIEVAKESGADVHVHKFERKGSDNERTEQMNTAVRWSLP